MSQIGGCGLRNRGLAAGAMEKPQVTGLRLFRDSQKLNAAERRCTLQARNEDGPSM